VNPHAKDLSLFFRARILARRDLRGRAEKRAELQEVTGHLAIRLVMAHRPVSILADDSWHLRDARFVPDHCFSRAALAPKSHLVRRLVQCVHGVIMAAQSFADPHQIGHLWGDVRALFVVAGALALLTLRANSPRAA
jgi:hypothetical protein